MNTHDRPTDRGAWESLVPELQRVITRQQPFGPPDAAQFTSSTELLRLLYDPSNRTHQQAESSGAPYVIGRKGAGKTAFVTAPKLDANAVPVELPSADVYQGVFDIVSGLVYGMSGFFFAHPAAIYFGLGKIDRDQVESYAARKGLPLAEMERWLSPNLNYDPRTASESAA